MAELSRIFSHLFWLGTHGHDVGAMTPLFYMLREREEIMNLFELTAGGAPHAQLHPHRRPDSRSGRRFR